VKGKKKRDWREKENDRRRRQGLRDGGEKGSLSGWAAQKPKGEGSCGGDPKPRTSGTEDNPREARQTYKERSLEISERDATTKVRGPTTKSLEKKIVCGRGDVREHAAG